MKMCLVFLALAFGAFVAHAESNSACTGFDASTLKHTLFMAQASKEPEAAIQYELDRLGAVVSHCPDNATIAYMHLRTAEVCDGMPAVYFGMSAAKLRERWHALAEDYARRFPGSAAIVTVQARATESVEVAERAVQLDPGYLPARAALAVALLKANRLLEAESAIGQVKNLHDIADGYTILARILFAKGDMAGAIRAGKLALKDRIFETVEPLGGNNVPIYMAFETLGLAYLKTGKYAEAAQALIDASAGSEQAAALLNDPEPKLRAELERIARRRRH